MAVRNTKKQSAYPKVRKEALVGAKKTGRPKPLATKPSPSMDRKRLY